MRSHWLKIVFKALIIVFTINVVSTLPAADSPAPVIAYGTAAGKPWPTSKGLTKAELVLRLNETTQGPGIPVGAALSNTFTISLRARVEKFPGEGKPKFDDFTPVTLFELHSVDYAQRFVVRFHNGKVQIATSGSGKPRTLSGTRDIAAGEWHTYQIVQTTDMLSLYIDNQLDLSVPFTPGMSDWKEIVLGRFGSMRKFLGEIDDLTIHDQALEIKTSDKSGDQASSVNNAPSPETLPSWITFGKYPTLSVSKDATHPLIDQLHISATVAPWTAPGVPSLLILSKHRRYFGSRLGLFRPVGKDDRGLPIYDSGETLTTLGGSQFMAVLRLGQSGLFDLFARGEGTPYGEGSLIRYVNQGAPGKPEFKPAQPVLVDNKPFAQALGRVVCGWWVGNVDDDDTPDLLVAGLKPGPPNAYWPDGEMMWKGEERANSGAGRGYDINGNWLGGEVISELFWAKGQLSANGTLSFGPLKKVNDRLSGYPVQWKSGETERAIAAARWGGKLYILHTGSVDQIRALPAEIKSGEITCAASIPLLSAGANVAGTYFIHSLTIFDLNGDGRPEILLDGNPGRVVVLQGDAPGAFREVGSLLMRGGQVTVDTLASPWRVDWDGDKKPDLIIGDASGWLTFWPGTDDPLIYDSPKFLTSGGVPIHHQAGMTGSIQGPNERRWGYLQPTVGDWANNGKLAIITNDIHGRLTLYNRTSEPTALSAPEVFTFEGRPLAVAWRSRPAIVPAKANLIGSNRPCLLFLDWDGDLAAAVPQSAGSTKIERIEKLRYDDGKTMRLCGPSGFWGRAELAVADWDEDGQWDILFGTSRACHRFFMSNPPAGATPLWLKNVGTSDKPVFRHAEPLRLKKGGLIDLDIHVASVCPTDLDGDSHLDLIIGAEDGKVYRFLRSELEW